MGINDNDTVVGNLLAGRGYEWSASSGITEVSHGFLMDVNNAGHAAGRADTGVPFTQAYIWRDGIAERLPNVLDRDFSWAWSINENGWIVGWSTDVFATQYATVWIPN